MLYVLSTRGWCFIFDLQEADCFIHHTYFYLYLLLLYCTFNMVIRHFRNIDNHHEQLFIAPCEKLTWMALLHRWIDSWIFMIIMNNHHLKVDLNSVVTQVNRLMKVFNLERLGAESESLSYFFIRFLNIFSGLVTTWGRRTCTSRWPGGSSRWRAPTGGCRTWCCRWGEASRCTSAQRTWRRRSITTQ